VKFWDASAVVPLLVNESSTKPLIDLLEQDPVVIVWWSSPVECTSAIARRERDGALSVSGATAALERLRVLSSAWHEVLPTDAVRATARRLLRVHPLRSAGSLQLAAAIVAAEHDPSTLEIVSLDDRLNEAASREGFRIVRV
jgi:predicted nucleic acid-binding protein